MEGVLFVVTLVVIFCLHGSDAAEFCYDSSDGFNSRWCDWGCCNGQCCEDTGTGMIVGIVVGCLIFVAIVVGTIVACVCCLRKSRGRQGQVVVQNNQAPGVVVQYPPPYGSPLPLAAPTGYPAPAQTQWPQPQPQPLPQQYAATNQQWQQQPVDTEKPLATAPPAYSQ